jgi:hypothetical protein
MHVRGEAAKREKCAPPSRPSPLYPRAGGERRSGLAGGYSALQRPQPLDQLFRRRKRLS